MKPRPVRTAIVSTAMLAVAVLGGACAGTRGVPEVAPAGSGPAVGFVVEPPDGLAVVSAVDGEMEPLWSSDTFGGVHPTVLLVPENWKGVSDRRWIAIDSYDGSGNQGGARQELPTYLTPGAEKKERIGGHPAVWSSKPGSVFVAVDASTTATGTFGDGPNGFAVHGPAADLGALRAVAEGVRRAPRHAPVVVDPPDGWVVLASLIGEQIASVSQVGGPPTQRQREVDLIVSGEQYPLRVTSVPGGSGTARALAIAASVSRSHWGGPAVAVEERSLGRRAWFLVDSDDPAVVAEVAGHALVLKGSVDLLRDDRRTARLLDSIRVVDEPTWDATVAAAAPSVDRVPPEVELLVAGEDGPLRWSIRRVAATTSPTSWRSDATWQDEFPAAEDAGFFGGCTIVVERDGQAELVPTVGGGGGGAGGIFSFVAVRSGDPGVIVVVAGPRDAVRGEFVGAGATHEFTLKPYGVASAVASFFVPGNELTTANTAVLLYRADGSTVE